MKNQKLISQIEKREKDRDRDKKYCKKCGHSVIFPKNSKRDRIICNHCGYYIFKNNLLEFEYRIKERLRKI